MRKRWNRIACIGVVIMIIIAFTACGQKTNENIAQTNKNEFTATATEPVSYGVGQKITGGETATNVNLKSISIEKVQDNTVISLSFLNGSKYSGVDETVMDYVPYYEIYQTESPYRLQIQLKGVSFWDWVNEEPDLSKQGHCPWIL